jgi:hypothetical protein
MIHSQYQAYISPARKIAPMGACVLKTSSPPKQAVAVGMVIKTGKFASRTTSHPEPSRNLVAHLIKHPVIITL